MKKKGFGEKLRALFSGGRVDDEVFDELEDLLIEADIGAKTVVELVDGLRSDRAHHDRTSVIDEIRRVLRGFLAEAGDLYSADTTNVLLILGVNGVGKTTTIAKLTEYYRTTYGDMGIVLAAGDTFRAAAVDQLSRHGERLGVRVVAQGPGADPAAVVYDALVSARSRGDRLVVADTAGRMHTKANLVAELTKIDRIVATQAANCNYRKILVIDGTTGQNAYQQAEIFHSAVGIDAVVLAKYDSTAKGGILVQICRNLGIPVAFLGRGEKYGDLDVFSTGEYIADILGE